jgi:hypothetical protein
MIHEIETHEGILKQYAEGPSLLDSALSGLSESDLDLAPSTDSWSIRQIVHHIVDGDDIWKSCIKAALGNNDASFSLQWYTVKTQMEWSESWAYASRGLESSLALFRANRRHIVDLLEHIPGSFEKTIRFKPSEKQEMCITVFDVVELHVRHLEEHIKEIQRILQVRQGEAS